jgi:hypothetical protein
MKTFFARTSSQTISIYFMRKNSIQKFLIATNRLITLLSLGLGFLVLPAAAIASPNAPVAAPTQITFSILNTCGSGDTYNFYLNGTAIGSVGANSSGDCTCGPALQTITASNTALLAGAWNSTGANALRVVKSGGSTYFAWVSAQLTFSTGSSRACYDYKGGDATQTNLCTAEYSNSAFDELLVTSTIFYRDADGDGFGDPNNFITDYNPSPGTAPAGYVTKGGDCEDSDATVPSQAPCLAKPFNKTAPGLGFTQELVASLPDGNPTSGYGFDSHGNPYTYSFNGNLYKIDLSTTVPAPGGIGTVHPLVNLGPIKYRTGSRTGQTIGTVYNFTQYPDGTVYANSSIGVVQVDLETATANSEPLPGSPWGIVVDPQLNSHGHHNIITAGGQVIDPVDHRYLGNCGIGGDGIAIDATGNFIFAAQGFAIYKRTSATGTDLPVFQSIGNYGGNPDGMAFGVVGTDQVVVSNDAGAGTVTMWKFPNNDFTKAPTPTIIASEPVSGEYGDQANVGPDGYFYITYWYRTRFPDGSTNNNTSVVRFGPAGRFLPPTHSDNLSLTPSTDTKTVGESEVLTATLVTTDLSTNQTVPLANTSVTFKVVGGPENGQTFTGTTDANGNVTFTLVNQNGEGDDVVHAQFVDGNGNTQTSNNSVITFVKPTCTVPAFTSCPGNQTANTLSTSCDNAVTYSSTVSVTGSPAPTITYAFTGATTGSGTGNGSGSLFNKGATTVTLTATSSCGSATCTFTVTVTDETAPMVTAPKNVTVSCDGSTAVADNGTATAQDGCDGAPVITHSDASTQDAEATKLGHYKYTITRTWTATDASGNHSSVDQIITVQDVTNPIAKCKSIEVYLGLDGTVSITGAQVDNGSFDNCSPVSLSVSPNSFNTSNVGSNSVTLTVTDVSGNSSTCQTTVTVKKRPTTLAYTGDGSEQYSDQQLLTAVLKDQLTNTVLNSKTISFVIGSQSASGITGVNGIASTNLVITQDPAPVYTVKSTFAGDGTFLPSSDEDPFDILQEDARAYYSGALFASTSGTSSSSATVTLSATVKDISAVSGDPAYDVFKGDIRNATITFVNRDNNTVLASNVPVGLVNLSDITIGAATKNVTLDIGAADAKQFTIGIIVNNYYTRNSSAENTIVTVSKPLDNFITGGGYIVLTSNSAGQKAGTQGTNNNFGFNVKYNKSNTNLQGNINTIIRRMETDNVLHVYQVKGNSMTSLAVNSGIATAKTATFNGKASIQDVTNPLAPVSVDGNATLQVTMTDKGEPGNTDDVGITVWNKNGGLWYSSNWNGVRTINQALAGGNIKVNGASYNAGSSSALTLKANSETMEIAADKLEVQTYPNPTPYSFTISVKSNDRKEKVTLRVANMSGRVVEMRPNIVSGQAVTIGGSYRPGTYVVEAIQGNQKVSVKLIKLPE